MLFKKYLLYLLILGIWERSREGTVIQSIVRTDLTVYFSIITEI